MRHATMRPCALCGRSLRETSLFPVHLLSQEIQDLLHETSPDLAEDAMVCSDDRARLRSLLVQRMLEREHDELTGLDKEILDDLAQSEIVAQNLNKVEEAHIKFGDKIADKVAAFGGSWAFIISFLSVMLVWMTLNTIALLNKPFDPYPFILLNLVLSSVAAIQAPVIMMSQNRQEARDRLRSEEDYRVNLKAEVEVRNINLKLDEMMVRQWQRLLELQQLQIELLESLQKRG
ncbi:MAG TPA: DUF1003 domain-containing protein [Fimbriimonadaceae bacterium]|nr:DUF1003 domain-containing protein [Fimbriimonadaceae bacterium]